MDGNEPLDQSKRLPVSWNEQTRQATLEHYHILDTVREQAFDELVELASALLQAPIALINFVGTDRQWFKAEIGLGCDELPLADSICQLAIRQSDVFVVPDLTKDRRYDGNAMVRAANGPRFYAGAVLETNDGLPLGTICVLDTEPRPEGITEWQRKGLKALAAQTMALLDYHVAARNYRFLTELNHVFQRVLLSGELIQTTVAALGAHLDIAQCGLAEIEAAQEYAQVDHEYGGGRIPSVVGRWRLRDFGGPLINDILAGTTTVIPDVAADPRTNAAETLAAFAKIHTRAISGVSLVRDGKVVAMLFNNHPTARRWTAAEVELIEEVCRRMWSAVERARARETAKARTTELEALLASAPIGIAYFDREHRYVRINHELAQTNGATIEAHLGQTMEHMIPELATAVVPHLDKVFATGIASREIEIGGETPRAPGIIYHWLVSFFPVFGDNDAVTSVGAFVVDITTRKQIEADLAANVAWLREAQEFGGVGSWTFNYQQQSGRVSSTYLSLHDFDAGEYTMGSARLMEAMHPDDREPFRKAVKRGLETRGQTSCDYRVITKDGKARWMRSTGRMIDDDDGTPTQRSSGIAEDVTEQILRTAELAHLNATLEDQVAARTRELSVAEAALRQSQKMEAMGQLTGGVAHDFNNLLTPIIGSLDMLIRRGLGNERERRLIDGALQSADRAKTLVQRLLAFARRQPLQPVAVDLAALITGMADLLGSTVGPNIDVQVELAADLPPASADANQLEMAILNLCVNARDAMPEGGTLTIAAGRESVRDAQPSGLRPGHYVRLSVTDTGTGMDEATLARAIEPFFSTKGIGKGTGLGLSMVHGLAAQLGGELTVVSKPGTGTTIALWLPVSASVIGAADKARVVPTVVQSRGHALLVDDEELVRMSTADMLADMGFEVTEAGSAKQALTLLKAGTAIDLVITDHLMPGMNGAELAREANRLRPGLPILIVSGYAEVEGIAPELPRLTKPFRQSELAEKLREFAGRLAHFDTPP